MMTRGWSGKPMNREPERYKVSLSPLERLARFSLRNLVSYRGMGRRGQQRRQQTSQEKANERKDHRRRHGSTKWIGISATHTIQGCQAILMQVANILRWS